MKLAMKAEFGDVVLDTAVYKNPNGHFNYLKIPIDNHKGVLVIPITVEAGDILKECLGMQEGGGNEANEES